VHTGGIKSTNAVRTLFGSITISGKSLDGLAVVSDIVASRDPSIAAKRLRDAVFHFKASRTKFSSLDCYTTESLKDSIGEALRYVRELSPLIHQVGTRRSLRLRGPLDDHERSQTSLWLHNQRTRRLHSALRRLWLHLLKKWRILRGFLGGY